MIVSHWVKKKKWLKRERCGRPACHPGPWWCLGPGLLPRAIFESVVLPQPQLASVSMLSLKVTRMPSIWAVPWGHVGVWGLCSHRGHTDTWFQDRTDSGFMSGSMALPQPEFEMMSLTPVTIKIVGMSRVCPNTQGHVGVQESCCRCDILV